MPLLQGIYLTPNPWLLVANPTRSELASSGQDQNFTSSGFRRVRHASLITDGRCGAFGSDKLGM